MEKIIAVAIPVFLLLIGLEYAYGRYRQRNTYRLSDTLSSLSQGLISQLLALVTQLLQIGLYIIVYRAVALFPQARIWNAWYGWIVAILMFDFCDYWLHRAGHECALMWAAHVVHHQSQYFNFSTSLRQESTVALIGWAFYLPMALLGVSPDMFALAGLVVLIYQFWIHTEHIGKLGWFDRVFSSPSNHRVHHAVNDQYIDKNYGGMLVIWDRMFGTFEEENEPCVYGTRTPLRSWDPLWAIFAEYRALAQAAKGARSWPDKLRVLFKKPGWRPAYALAENPPSAFDLQQASVLYDPPLPGQGRGPGLSSAATYIALAQFTLMLAASSLYIWYSETLPYDLSLVLTAGIIAGLWALGAFLESKMSLKRLLIVDLIACTIVALSFVRF